MSELRRDEGSCDEDWEIVDDVSARRPAGLVLKVRFAPASVDGVLAAAEASGLNVADFARRAVLLVARDARLREQLVPTPSRADT